MSDTDSKNEVREAQRAWLLKIMEATNKSASRIAMEAGVQNTTLTRFLKSANYTGTLNALTIKKITDKFNVPPPSVTTESDNDREALGFGEGERFDYKAQPDALASVVESMIAGRNAVDAWRLKTRALELAGYMPGDILIVDLNADPMNGDVVVAQLYDWQRGIAETVFRIYERPYLVAACTGAFRRPLLVDDNQIIIKGVVVGQTRPWRVGKPE